MTNILQIATVFLAELALGSALLLPFFPLKITGKSFTRFYYGLIVITLGLFLFCLYRLGQFDNNYLLFSSLAVWIWILSFTKTHTKTETYLMWVFAFCSLALMFIYPQKHIFHGVSFWYYIPSFLVLLIGAVFLAFSTMNMIFGHWYLVNRELPIKHLIKTSRYLIYFTYLRLVTVAVSTFLAYSYMTPDSFARLLDFMGHGVFFWARILAGLGIPLLVCHLSYESAKIHSNQSATGILYAGLVFVIMGEIMGLYLFSITGFLF